LGIETRSRQSDTESLGFLKRQNSAGLKKKVKSLHHTLLNSNMKEEYRRTIQGQFNQLDLIPATVKNEKKKFMQT
jgi:hypothetical protein